MHDDSVLLEQPRNQTITHFLVLTLVNLALQKFRLQQPQKPLFKEHVSHNLLSSWHNRNPLPP